MSLNASETVANVKPSSFEAASHALPTTGWKHGRLPLADRYWVQVLRTSLPLLVADALALMIMMAIGYGVALFLSPRELNHPIAFTFAAIGLQTLMLTINGLYPAAGVHPAVELRQLVLGELQLAILTMIFLGGVQDSWQSPYIPMGVTAFLLASVAIPVFRSFARGWCCRFPWWGYPTLLVGDYETCERVARLFNRDGRQGLRPLGIFRESDDYWNKEGSDALKWLGPIEEAVEFARNHHAYWLIIALPEHLDDHIKQQFESLRRGFPHVIMIDSRHELPCLWNRAVDCGGLAAMKVEERLLMPEQQFSKRTLDLFLVIIGAFVLVPLMMALAFILWVTNGRPILYFGTRVGRDGKEFKAWKFRSMINGADQVLRAHLDANPDLAREYELENKLKSDPRITRMGGFIRRTSLDELPQLWNVLVGDMSLVGPRPILPNEVAKYGSTMREYATVRPGITGMWQISGRNDTTYEERKAYVRYYVRNWSPWLDLYILARTIKVVLRCEGAY